MTQKFTEGRPFERRWPPSASQGEGLEDKNSVNNLIFGFDPQNYEERKICGSVQQPLKTDTNYSGQCWWTREMPFPAASENVDCLSSRMDIGQESTFSSE